MANLDRNPARRRGTVLVFTAVSLTALIGFAALAIDIGYMYAAQADLQKGADAAALAGVKMLPDEAAAVAEALNYANINLPGQGTVLALSDLAIGNWDADVEIFVQAGTPINAMRVRTRRAEDNGNALSLFFAGIFGITQADVSAVAIAAAPSGSTASRFLIDNEMIDSDIPAIENLANNIGMATEDIISDLDDDWFIDLWQHCASVSCQFELPTGQLGDAALFDIDHSAFPFTNPASPGKPPLLDFLNYNEDGSWRDDPAVKALLDPLVGISTVEDASLYPSYVNPDFVHVSPVYKSDVSSLNPQPHPQPGTPAVNALGLRRGLIAFKIIGVGADPDGAGSVLPNLIIEVISPAGIDLSSLGGGGSGTGSGSIAYLVE